MELHDWSTYMLRAKSHLKEMENKLLHKNYTEIAAHAYTIKESVDKAMAWAAAQRGGADIVEILEDNLPSVADAQRYVLLAAIQEIKQLRDEKSFMRQVSR